MGKPKAEPRAAWADGEAPDAKRKRARTVLRRLEKAYPDTRTALDYTNAFELVVATVLSAQSTDKMVNIITKDLFRKYKTPQDYLKAKPGELEQDIKASGFFNQKAKSIRGLSQKLVDDFDGKVPETMEELITLPGVARKTANVVLGNAFGKNEGIAVDTHVHRLSWRLAFSDHDDPNKVEQDLMKLFPRAKWFNVSHLLIDHGRNVCFARNPNCAECVVNELCPAARVPATRKKA
ncbi:MAG TPA: endonuclease III [Actinomycetota bacterium]|nr:endonuclease III [Actinomycetota bacterium]